MTFLAPYADPILFVMTLIFTVSLLPTIYHQFRVRECSVALSTVGMSLAALTLATLAYSSLGLWFATSMAVVNMGAWVLVGAQRVSYKS